MTINPIVTVATLCFNNSEHVIKTIDSIRKQTYKNIDHIIIDDCSTDESAQNIGNWISSNNCNCRYIQNEKNIGICRSLNKIVSLARGEFVAINCDDYWETFHIERSLKILAQSGADVIYSRTRICNASGDFLNYLEDTLKTVEFPRYPELFPVGNEILILSNATAVDALFYSNYLHIISLVIPKSAILSLGGFDENLPFEDWDLNFKICSKLKVCFNKTFSVTYYQHDKSYTQTESKKVYLHWGIALTLVKHLSLIIQSDTRKAVEQHVLYRCLEVLRYKPRKIYKVASLYNKIMQRNFPGHFGFFLQTSVRNYKHKVLTHRSLTNTLVARVLRKNRETSENI